MHASRRLGRDRGGTLQRFALRRSPGLRRPKWLWRVHGFRHPRGVRRPQAGPMIYVDHSGSDASWQLCMPRRQARTAGYLNPSHPSLRLSISLPLSPSLLMLSVSAPVHHTHPRAEATCAFHDMRQRHSEGDAAVPRRAKDPVRVGVGELGAQGLALPLRLAPQLGPVWDRGRVAIGAVGWPMWAVKHDHLFLLGRRNESPATLNIVTCLTATYRFEHRCRHLLGHMYAHIYFLTYQGQCVLKHLPQAATIPWAAATA